MGRPVIEREEHPAAVSRKKQCVLAVCGVKNSGKTTLIEKLVRRFAALGYSVAVLKHDGHEFSCDVPGTDSYRFWEAGACGTAVFSGSQFFIRKKWEREEKNEKAYTESGKEKERREKERARRQAEKILSFFPEADILLVEGMKDSTFPKIEVIRREISDAPASNPCGRFLLVTDWEKETFDENVLRFDEIEALSGIILEHLMNL